MATINNIKGTSYPSFRIGLKGPTIYQSESSLDNLQGNDSDLYINKTSSLLSIKQSGEWKSLQISSSNLSSLSNVAPEDNNIIGFLNDEIVKFDSNDISTILNLGDASTRNIGTSPGNLIEVGLDGTINEDVLPNRNITIIDQGDNITLDGSEYFVLVKGTGTGSTTINLPIIDNISSGKIIVIKDSSGVSSNDNVIINSSSGIQIDGQNSVVIGINYESITLLFDGSDWNIV